MDKTLVKGPKIVQIKSKFFLYRIVTYFSFILLPVWIQKLLPLNPIAHSFLMILYILFMGGQWFLLGKEIDHRLKIYFKVNSSMDRVIYRLLLGKCALLVYFGLLSFLPRSFLDDFFWGTWVVLGVFYSWPTRGKIIQETVSSQLGEFKFLDSFEKTVLALSALFFIISIPSIPPLENIEALKLYFDPFDKFAPQYWNFLYINYFPFVKYRELFRLAWCMHFYVVGSGLFLLAFYGIARVFLSRRLSILGVFAILTSWSFSKIFVSNYGSIISSTFSVLWIWAILWGTKSATYRSGLFLGLLGYLGTLINQSYFLLLPIQLFLFYFFFLEEKTFWFKRQLLKYALPGILLGSIALILNLDSLDTFYSADLKKYMDEFLYHFNRKAFYWLSILGLGLLTLKFWNRPVGFIRDLRVELNKLIELLASVLILIVFTLLFDSFLVQSFSLIAFFAFLSLVPLEWIFQSISRLRSRRNIIYVFYVVVCLLDSHFEGRIKILTTLID